MQCPIPVRPRPSADAGRHGLRAFAAICLSAALALFSALAAQAADPAVVHGIAFACPSGSLNRIAADFERYALELGIAPQLWAIHEHPGKLRFALNTPPGDTNTLDFHVRPEMAVKSQPAILSAANGGSRVVETVSEKEIVLALMQRGRLTEFSGRACDIEALRDHVGIRRNIAAWGEKLEWGWPDGEPAKWADGRFWQRGTPVAGTGLKQALDDIFHRQPQYEIGCYAAAKLTVIQGIHDYFLRVKKSPSQAALVEKRLLADGEPLDDVEPDNMWSFEPDYVPAAATHPGKMVRVVRGVVGRNFVPGDWVYFFNTDPKSYTKTGYEGANPIYLGRNRFVDYFNDHDHGYSFEQKVDEVWQWRNGVFSRSRDAARRIPLAPADFERLARTPEEGGLLLSLRAVPYLFGFEELPGAK